MYSTEQRVQIVKWYYAGNSLREIVQLFIVAFENHPAPSKNFVSVVLKNFEETGCVSKCKCHKTPKQPNEQEEIRETLVLARIQQDDTVSSRKLGEELNLDAKTV